MSAEWRLVLLASIATEMVAQGGLAIWLAYRGQHRRLLAAVWSAVAVMAIAAVPHYIHL